MAVDHSSVPKDLRPSASPGRAHAPPPWASIAPSAGGPLFSSSAAVAAADDHLSSRKVKLLCSFGGRILPRPSDGTLRYAGGHTRIISIRKDVSFAEFVSKMAEAVGGAAVAVKYQLPGEDLDSLISVSCPEDLVNLMEEYDKLAAASLDGSFKLRAFLFSPSELSSADISLHHAAVDDADQRYVEALNAFSVSDGSRGLRSNSFTSAASSTQNSEGTVGGDAMDDGMGEGMSPSFPSPAADSPNDAPRLVYVGGNNPTMTPNAAVGIQGGTVLPPGMSFAAQNPTLGRPEMPPMGPYVPPPYMEPHQLHYVNPQHLGMVGGLQQINVAPLPMHSFVPSGVPNQSPSNMPALIDHLQAMQPRLATNFDNPYGGKVLQPLSQLPPLPPTCTPSPHSQPQARLEDCLMCQKALPHAHSDTLVQERGIGTSDSFPETSSMFYSQRSVPVGTGALVHNLPGLNAENMNAASQFAGSVLPHVPDVQHFNTRPIVQHPGEENSSDQRLFVDNYMQRQFVNPLQLQQHQVWERGQPPSYLIKQEMVTGLPNEESLLLQHLQTGQMPNCMVRQEGVMSPSDAGVYANYHSIRPTAQGYVHRFPDENVELVERRMEALQLGPLGTSETTHQGKPATTHIDAPSSLVVENSHNVEPQFGDSALCIGDAGGNYRYVVPDGNYSKPIEQVPSRGSEVILLQRPQNEQNANMINHHDPFPYNLGISDYPGHVHTLENIEPVGLENVMPPIPSRIVSKESAAPNHRAVGSDIVSMLEEGMFHHPPDTMIKDLGFESVRLAKGTEEENIKQQLQAVAEDVAASVFQPPVPPSSPAPETKKLAPETNNEMRGTAESKELDKIVPDEEKEDSMAKQSSQENQGIHLTEDMGRLQIIKNCDLEELQELGSGTFGTVFHGKWRGTDVAIKRINDRCFAGKKSEEERMRADFWNEACKLSDLHHPNVVAFYGVVLDGPGGSIATVTEYMVNGSLRQALQRNHRAFDRRQRFLIAMDVAFGMEYLHAKSIVHFDLKSDNLLVNLRDSHRPICKVGDLGLSKVKCKTLISGGMRGTLPWMAPELLYGNDSLVSEKVDVFSFGIVMWEIMTGEEPYADLHYGAIIGGILSNTLRPPVPDSCDPEWRALMEQCWSAEPPERPSFTEIANQLRCMASALSQKAQQHQAAHK